MSQANARLLADKEYLNEINQELKTEGLEYKGTVDPKHLLWVLVEDIGIDKLKSLIVQKLEGLKLAPFYGCYIVRPSKALGLDENPERENIIGRTGPAASPVAPPADHKIQRGQLYHPTRRGGSLQ